MERETVLSQVDLEAPFQADLELEADEFESNNVPNEPNENYSTPEKVHSIAEALLSLSNILCWLSQFSFSKLRQPTGQRLSNARGQQK